MSVFDQIAEATKSRAIQEVRKLIPSSLPTSSQSEGASIGVNATPIPHRLITTSHPNFMVTIRQEPNRTGSKQKTVIGTLPEVITSSTTAEWDTPFADGLLGGGRLQTFLMVSGWVPTVQALTAHFWKGSTPIDLSIPLTLTANSDADDILTDLLTLKSMATPTKEATTGFLRAPGPLLDYNAEQVLPYVKQLGNTVATAGGELIGAVMDKFSLPNLGFGDNGKRASETQTESSRLDNVKTAIGETVKAADKVLTVTGKISVRLGKFLYFEDVIIRTIDESTDVTLAPDGRPLKTTVTVNFTTRLTPTFEDIIKMHMTTKDAYERRASQVSTPRNDRPR